jgi:tetratricopeptide (TPR) repeat protein
MPNWVRHTSFVPQRAGACLLLLLAFFSLEHSLAQTPSADNARLLLWTTHSKGQSSSAIEQAERLLASAPDDPLAAAVLLWNSATRDVKPFELAQNALEHYAGMQNPGLDARDFYSMQRFVASTLSAAAGEGFLARKDYEAARTFLKRAVEVDPNNGRSVYSLAQAYLSGKDPDPKQGYSYLARAVNLTRGNPGGQQIAAYARKRYMEDGGTSADWDRFLVAAGAKPSVASTETARTAPPVGSTIASTKQPQPEPTSATTAATARDVPPRPSNATSTAPQPGDADRPPSREDKRMEKEATDEEKSEDERKRRLAELKDRLERPAPVADETPRPAPPPRPAASADSPVSIGVVLQTEKADGSSRKAVINGLSDMVRRLRNDDEAFVLSFGESMVLEEDLTSNSALLEKAMDEISGSSGTALYDAVSFSAGHLARIAKNRNRALLVISDGSVESSSVSPFQASQEIQNSGVRIFCIGLDVSSSEDQRRLTTLASNTGGQAMFVSGANQFRAAARSIANRMGVPF